jgi:glycopeptide antibiotics resistance protein
MNRRVGILSLVLYAIGCAALTLGPSPGDLLFRVAQQVEGLDSLPTPAIEALANLVLFVPLGLLLCALLPRLRRLAVWALGVAASVTIELVQFLLPERSPSLRDVVINSLGAALGVVLHTLVFRRHRRSDGAGTAAG